MSVVEAGDVVGLLAATFTDLMVGPLAAVQVYDQPNDSAGWSERALTVGDPLVDDQQPVETVQREDGPGRRAWVEHEVACAAWAYTGDEDDATARGQTAEVVAAVRAKFWTDPTLGGQVARVQLGEQRQGVASDDRGTVQVLAFTVRVLVLP